MPQGPLNTTIANQNGSARPGVLDAQSALGVAQMHGKYYESNYAGRVFSAANQAGKTISAGLATTYTGLCLSNPAGSGKLLAVQRIKGVIGVAPTGVEVIGLIIPTTFAGITVHTTTLTVEPSNIGLTTPPTPVGLCDEACTLVGTPRWLDWLQSSQIANDLLSFDYDADGGIILQPGSWLAIGSTAASTASALFGSIEWEELPQ